MGQDWTGLVSQCLRKHDNSRWNTSSIKIPGLTSIVHVHLAGRQDGPTYASPVLHSYSYIKDFFVKSHWAGQQRCTDLPLGGSFKQGKKNP